MSINIKINRRSFLKGLGGLATLALVPTSPTVPQLLIPLVFINGKRLPANRMNIKLTLPTGDSKQRISDTIVAEFLVDAANFSGAKPDYSLGIPVNVVVQMSDELTYIGRGVVTQYTDEYAAPWYTYHMTIAMWSLSVC